MVDRSEWRRYHHNSSNESNSGMCHA